MLNNVMSNLKKINKNKILKIIFDNGPTSRIEIAQMINITRAAVTMVVNEMIQEGILYEKGQEIISGKSRRGRRKVLLDINKNYKFCFGIVFDNNKIYMGLTNLKGETLDKEILCIDNNKIEKLIEIIHEKFHQILKNSSLQIGDLIGMGVCISENCLSLLNAKDKDAKMLLLKKMIERRIYINVVVNDTIQGLAIAESIFDDNYKEKALNSVFIRYGYDIDAVITIQGKIYQRPSKDNDWFSHIMVDTKGEYCECGKKGCYKTKISKDAIKQKMTDLHTQGKITNIYEITKGDISKLDLTVENINLISSDSSIRELYQEQVQYLANALDSLVTVLDLQKIILFGFIFEYIIDIQYLISVMKREHNISIENKVKLSVIQSTSIHLAGNGICIEKLFIELQEG